MQWSESEEAGNRLKPEADEKQKEKHLRRSRIREEEKT